MPNPTYYIQDCPTCGRRLQIRVEHMGRTVVCQHCRGKFKACDPESSRYTRCDEANTLIQRADELLRQAALQAQALRVAHPR